jgi:hypothetical protein
MTEQQGWYLIEVLSLWFAYCVHPLLNGETAILCVFAGIGSIAFVLGIKAGFEDA